MVAYQFCIIIPGPLNLCLVHHPHLDRYVFLKANKREEGILVAEDTVDQTSDRVDLEEGAQFLISYRPIADLVQNGSVSLL